MHTTNQLPNQLQQTYPDRPLVATRGDGYRENITLVTDRVNLSIPSLHLSDAEYFMLAQQILDMALTVEKQPRTVKKNPINISVEPGAWETFTTLSLILVLVALAGFTLVSKVINSQTQSISMIQISTPRA